MLNERHVGSIWDFTYLGSKITTECHVIGKNVISIVNQAKAVFSMKGKLFTSNNINLKLRKQLLKTYVWSVLLYGSES